MLQQILKDMYIEPELLEELSDEQKQVLFFKLREEQIRRFKVWDEKLQEEDKNNPRPKKGGKAVNFLCDENDKVIVHIFKEDNVDGAGQQNIFKKRLEEEALKRAEDQAKKEAEERRKKQLEEMKARREAEEKRLRDEEERLKIEREKREAELRKKAEEAALHQSLKEARLQKERSELEHIELERKRIEEEVSRKKALEEMRLREEAEKKKREEELLEQERIRKKELYEKMKKEQEEKERLEEEERVKADLAWEEREVKAKEADQQRRSSFSHTRSELQRMKKLAQEKAELDAFRKSDAEPEMKEKLRTVASVSLEAERFSSPSSSPPLPIGTHSKRKNPNAPKRPPLPVRPTISVPLNVTSTQTDGGRFVSVKRNVVKPSRPPPAPKLDSMLPASPSTNSKSRQMRPPRPKSRAEVTAWWREEEFDRGSGLDENKKPLEWLHGIISRTQAEKLLESKPKGAFLVRVSERVWGYVLSFKDFGKCKHFIIDTSSDTYQFFGTGQLSHNRLNDLVVHHKTKPVSGLGQEVLRTPVGQENPSSPDYADLFQECTMV